MNIFQRAVKSFAQVLNPQNNDLLKAIFQWQIHTGIASPMLDNPTSYLTQGYSGNADVFSIINRQLRMASQARLALYTRDKSGKWVEVPDHELNYFTRHANPTMTINEFMDGHIIYKQSIGNSYWYKPTLEFGLNKGKTKELWLMPANNVTILGGSSWMDPIGGYQLDTNTMVDFKKEEVYHSKFFNPLFGLEASLYGQSPLKAAARIVSKQNEAENTELKQFQNQSPPYLLYKDSNDPMGGLSGRQAGELEDQFKDYNKKYKSGLPIVLRDKFGMIKLGVSAVDLNILESSREGKRTLCNIYGMAAGLFNDTENLTYNNMPAMESQSWTNCVKPLCDSIGRELTACLIDPVEEYVKAGLFFGFDYSEVAAMQKDRGAMVTWMKQAYLTPNEVRESVGFDPISNPIMNEPFFNMSETPLSQMSELPDLTTPPELKNMGDYK
jgi:HK97 family phage portal protein